MPLDQDDPKLTAYALGELSDSEFKTVDAAVMRDDDLQKIVSDTRTLAHRLAVALRDEPEPVLKPIAPSKLKPTQYQRIKPFWTPLRFAEFAVCAAILLVFICLFIPPIQQGRRSDLVAERMRESAPPDSKIAFPEAIDKSVAANHESNNSYIFMQRRSPENPSDNHSKYTDIDVTEQSVVDSNEIYASTPDNAFHTVERRPLSTFSIDVDTASYSNVRRFLNEGSLPPRDAVRIEELINYFTYEDASPDGDDPLSIRVEIAQCPWNVSHRLARIGLKAKEIPWDKLPPANLVFLVDVSGSMDNAAKLPLLKAAIRMLVEKLREQDRVAIVTYASNVGIALRSTRCDRKREIFETLDRLSARGSTNGGSGIQIAYDSARANFIEGGLNRVILATDGDFNVGIADRDLLIQLIEHEAATGVYLSVLGFGMGNLKDATLEQLADKGNGNYAYIDSLSEARKALVDQTAGTLATIAQDVKIQLEFNPERVKAYRLIGYENRIMRHQDFHDDSKDAGEIGAGGSVTALYEIVPAGEAESTTVGKLKYRHKSDSPAVQPRPIEQEDASRELLTVKLRYKRPGESASKLIERGVIDEGRSYSAASNDFRFAAAVAAFGMILRDSPHKGTASLDQVHELASESLGADHGGFRGEFVELVIKAKRLRGR